MGREWSWVSGRSSKRGGRGGDQESASTTPGCMCSVFQLFDFHQFQLPSQQQQQPTLNLDSNFLYEEHPISEGAEAPRNSLELDESPSPKTIIEENESLNISMPIQIKTNGDTSNSKLAHGAPNDSSSSEITSSPSTKTPTLVARLMGLDLLPDHTYSPICSTLETPNPLGKSHSRRRYSLQPRHGSSDSSGTRSLPETPRISSARRSDVEHRLSLQINKENISPNEELVLSRISSLKRKELRTEEENRSPGHYARQIVKQVKESVSRKVGLDITNTERSRDHELVNQQLKTKKIRSKVLTKVGECDSSSPAKNSTASASCSPRLKFLEARNNKQVSSTVVPSTKDHNILAQSPKPSIAAASVQVNVMSQKTKAPTKPKLQPVQEQVHQDQQRPIKECKKVAEEKFGPPPRLKKPPQTSDIIRNKQEEPFVRQATISRANIPDKKCKKTPLSSDLLNITVPTLLPVKKDPTTPRATKIPPKQAPSCSQESKRSSQLFSCSSQSYKEQEETHTRLNVRGNISSNNEDVSRGAGAGAAATSSTTTTGAQKEEYEYISRILRRTGIDKDTPVSFTRWFSPSHPLDPSIFYYLEYFTASSFANSKTVGQLRHRCNRKLLFHLVDEILVDILKPYLNMKPWVERFSFTAVNNSIQGSDLGDILCSRIRSFPCADCRVLEDIDAIVARDMSQPNVQNDVAFSEEGEGIVMELEKALLDTLMHETALVIYGGI